MRFEKVTYKQYFKDFEGDILLKRVNPYSLEEVKISDINERNLTIPGFESVSNEFVKYIYDSIKIPKRATKKSAGYDFYAPYDFTLNPGDTLKIATGIRVILDDDKFLMCAPRSGHGFKARIQLDNTIGVIDADYSDSSNEGHIVLKLTNDSHTGKSISVKKGEGMMQAIIMQYFKVEDDTTEDLRDGGFGSTDQKESK